MLFLQRSDVWQVFVLQWHGANRFRSYARAQRPASAQGVRCLQGIGDIELYLLLLQGHGQEREFQVLVL